MSRDKEYWEAFVTAEKKGRPKCVFCGRHQFQYEKPPKRLESDVASIEKEGVDVPFYYHNWCVNFAKTVLQRRAELEGS